MNTNSSSSDESGNDNSNVYNNQNKKRRSVDAMSLTSSLPSDFCHKGELFKQLLDNAIVKVSSVAIDFHTPSLYHLYDQKQQQQQQPQQQYSSNSNDEITTNGSDRILKKLNQEKGTECLLLQQKINSQQTVIAHLEAIVDDLRESKMQQAAAETRIRIALKQASQNATIAREQARSAEANAAKLATKVEAFEAVVAETKRSSMLLFKEQEEVGFGLEGMERDFVQAQADLARFKVQKKKMLEDKNKMKQNIFNMKDSMDKLQERLEDEKSKKLIVVRKLENSIASLEVEQNRSKRLTEELNSQNATLVESTAIAADSRACIESGQQALDRVSEANQHLHKKLEEAQKHLLKEKESHQEELERIQKEYQTTQLQLNGQKDILQKFKLEKLSAEKQQKCLASKISALEKRLHCSLSVLPCTQNTVPSRNKPRKANGDGNIQNQHSNVNHRELRLIESKCSICFRDVLSGGLLIRKCQCGKKGCKVRAHVACLKQLNTSPSEKLVLCSTLVSNSTEQCTKGDEEFDM